MRVAAKFEGRTDFDFCGHALEKIGALLISYVTRSWVTRARQVVLMLRCQYVRWATPISYRRQRQNPQ
jgi:hypothetical protein